MTLNGPILRIRLQQLVAVNVLQDFSPSMRSFLQVLPLSVASSENFYCLQNLQLYSILFYKQFFEVIHFEGSQGLTNHPCFIWYPFQVAIIFLNFIKTINLDELFILLITCYLFVSIQINFQFLWIIIKSIIAELLLNWSKFTLLFLVWVRLLRFVCWNLLFVL